MGGRGGCGSWIAASPPKPLQEMREAERQMFYLMGTPQARLSQYEKFWLELPWQKVRDSVEVKLFSQDGEM